MDKILVSACLLGKPVRYHGRGKPLDHDLIMRWHLEGRLVSICPEVIAGFPTPRPPAEIANGANGNDVLDKTATIHEFNGGDVTSMFLKGAEIALKTAQKNKCKFALLTDGSPSCGSTYVYDGSFNNSKIAGLGVVTALLNRHGIEVYSEKHINELAGRLV